MSDSFYRTYQNSLREARFVMLLWFITMTWTICYCYFQGYLTHSEFPFLDSKENLKKSSDSIPMLWGFPTWLVYGVMIPWFLCVGISVVYGLYIMKDDDLGKDPEEEIST